MPPPSEFARSTATKTLARPSWMVIVCVMSVPHISLTLSVMIVPSCGLASVRPTRCGASKPLSRITRRTRRGLARTPAKRNRAHNLLALAVKAGGGDVPADVVCQFRVRTCADRTGATGARVRRRLIERAIADGARDLPGARNARQTITTSQGGRECLAHRLDLLWAKGRLPSSAAILA